MALTAAQALYGASFKPADHSEGVVVLSKTAICGNCLKMPKARLATAAREVDLEPFT